MRERVKRSIGLKSQNFDAEVDIYTAWETIRENIKISAKESLGCYKLKCKTHGSMKDDQNY
jgi:hypothetical protein